MNNTKKLSLMDEDGELIANTPFGEYVLHKDEQYYHITNYELNFDAVATNYAESIEIMNKHFNEFINSIVDDTNNLQLLLWESFDETVWYTYIKDFYIEIVDIGDGTIVLTTSIKLDQDEFFNTTLNDATKVVYDLINTEIQKLISTGDDV